MSGSPSRGLLVSIELVGDRWHGAGEWPPSPFRLFQALVAGAYGARWSAEDCAAKDEAFRWFERLAAPSISAPRIASVRQMTTFVPNNDLDAVGGNPARIDEIRAAKICRTTIFEGAGRLLYGWEFSGDDVHALRVCGLADRLHTFGRGVDAAFARAEILTLAELEARLYAHDGVISRPTETGALGRSTLCPTRGSIESLKARHAQTTARFETVSAGALVSVRFRQPSKAVARRVAYDCRATRLLYELRDPEDLRRTCEVPLTKTLRIAEAVRQAAKQRLVQSSPELEIRLSQYLIGADLPPQHVGRRIAVTPLPAPQTPSHIRSLAVDIPAGCPVPVADLAWALTGLELADPRTRAVFAVLAAAPDRSGALDEKGSARPSVRWRTLTPAVAPEGAWADPSSEDETQRGARVLASVSASLRHAGLPARPWRVSFADEPSSARIKASAFDPGQFAGGLGHLEVHFDRPVEGPLVVGEGRFVGLGLLEPVEQDAPDLHLFAIDPRDRAEVERASVIARALRRAVMARAQIAVGEREPLPAFFSGHDRDGQPLRTGRHEHLFFVAEDCDGDGKIDRLAVVAPHRVDRQVKPSHERLNELERALSGLGLLRGKFTAPLRLRALPELRDDPTFGWARTWTSQTPYRPTRHPRRSADIEPALRQDVLVECARRGLPRPDVEILGWSVGPRDGVAVTARLQFATQVQGPILLGAGSHIGSGLFRNFST